MPRRIRLSKNQLGVAHKLIKSAREWKVDPLTAVTVGLRESSLGDLDKDNPMRVSSVYHPGLVNEDFPATEAGMMLLRDAMKKGKTEREGLQRYNGLIKGKGYPYADKVLAERELLKAHPQIDSLMNIKNTPVVSTPQVVPQKKSMMQRQADFQQENSGPKFKQGGRVKKRKKYGYLDAGFHANDPSLTTGPFDSGHIGANGPISFKDGGPIITNDPNDPRLKAYKDSLNLYNNSLYNWELAKSTADSIVTSDKGTVVWNSKLDKLPLKNIKSKSLPVKRRTVANLNNPEYFKDTKGNVTTENKNYKARDFSLYKEPTQPVKYRPKDWHSDIKKETSKYNITKGEMNGPPNIELPKVQRYMMPDGKWRNYEELTRDYPSMKDQRVFKKNFPNQRTFEEVGYLWPNPGVVYDKGYYPKMNFGGVLGSILSTAAPLAGLIPGVGMIASPLLQMAGNKLQKDNQPTMGDGGSTQGVDINVEGSNRSQGSITQMSKGELLAKGGRVLKNYVSRPPHPSEGMNPEGDTTEEENMIVIPKKRSQEYLNADRRTRKSIERSLVSQQEDRANKALGVLKQAGHLDPAFFMKGGKVCYQDGGRLKYDDLSLVGGAEGQYDWNPAGGLPTSYNAPQTSLEANTGTISDQSSVDTFGLQPDVYGEQDWYSPRAKKPFMSQDEYKRSQNYGMIAQAPGIINNLVESFQPVEGVNPQKINALGPRYLKDSGKASRLSQYKSNMRNARSYGLPALVATGALNSRNEAETALKLDNANAGIYSDYAGRDLGAQQFNSQADMEAQKLKLMGKAARRTFRGQALSDVGKLGQNRANNDLYYKYLQSI